MEITIAKPDIIEEQNNDNSETSDNDKVAGSTENNQPVEGDINLAENPQMMTEMDVEPLCEQIAKITNSRLLKEMERIEREQDEPRTGVVGRIQLQSDWGDE